MPCCIKCKNPRPEDVVFYNEINHDKHNLSLALCIRVIPDRCFVPVSIQHYDQSVRKSFLANLLRKYTPSPWVTLKFLHFLSNLLKPKTNSHILSQYYRIRLHQHISEVFALVKVKILKLGSFALCYPAANPCKAGNRYLSFQPVHPTNDNRKQDYPKQPTHANYVVTNIWICLKANLNKSLPRRLFPSRTVTR